MSWSKNRHYNYWYLTTKGQLISHTDSKDIYLEQPTIVSWLNRLVFILDSSTAIWLPILALFLIREISFHTLSRNNIHINKTWQYLINYLYIYNYHSPPGILHGFPYMRFTHTCTNTCTTDNIYNIQDLTYGVLPTPPWP